MQRALGIARGLGGATLVAGVAIEFFIYDVDAGKRAVIFDKVRGILPEPVGEGTHFKIPFLQVSDFRTCVKLHFDPVLTKSLLLLFSRSPKSWTFAHVLCSLILRLEQKIFKW
jgi:hypothetical protein